MNKNGKSLSAIGHFPRYSKTFVRALKTPLLLYIAAVGNGLLVLSAYLFYHFEKGKNASVEGLFDAVWWAFTTVSTVGFGDITPVTFEGRLVGIFLMITGVTLFVGFTALFVSVISSLTASKLAQQEGELSLSEFHTVIKEIQALDKRLDRIEKSITASSTTQGKPIQSG